MTVHERSRKGGSDRVRSSTGGSSSKRESDRLPDLLEQRDVHVVQARERAGRGVQHVEHLIEPHLLLAHVAEVVVVGKVLEERQEGARDLAETVLAASMRLQMCTMFRAPPSATAAPLVVAAALAAYASSTLAENARRSSSLPQPHRTLGMHSTTSACSSLLQELMPSGETSKSRRAKCRHCLNCSSLS